MTLRHDGWLPEQFISGDSKAQVIPKVEKPGCVRHPSMLQAI